MEAVQIIAPLVGVVLGAALSGVGTHLRSRAERRRVLALALADLLEVRHHVAGVDLVLREVRRRFEVPRETVLVIRQLIETAAPIGEEVHTRYNSAITLLAGIDPFLAFQMRSKNSLPSLLSSARQMSAQGGMSVQEIDELEDLLVNAALPGLTESVLQLARRHSYFTLRRVRSHLTKSNEIPPELANFLDKAEAALQQSTSSAA